MSLFSLNIKYYVGSTELVSYTDGKAVSLKDLSI